MEETKSYFESMYDNSGSISLEPKIHMGSDGLERIEYEGWAKIEGQNYYISARFKQFLGGKNFYRMNFRKAD